MLICLFFDQTTADSLSMVILPGSPFDHMSGRLDNQVAVPSQVPKLMPQSHMNSKYNFFILAHFC